MPFLQELLMCVARPSVAPAEHKKWNFSPAQAFGHISNSRVGLEVYFSTFRSYSHAEIHVFEVRHIIFVQLATIIENRRSNKHRVKLPCFRPFSKKLMTNLADCYIGGEFMGSLSEKPFPVFFHN